ncbi:unnamed protein product [Closterium sp. NIES-65]|nr:unnamed protein product [Closterium sp. NIES-65]
MDRRCTFVALGGGVVGDMTGFAAASYLRGVNFIQIPTTVMSQVCSLPPPKKLLFSLSSPFVSLKLSISLRIVRLPFPFCPSPLPSVSLAYRSPFALNPSSLSLIHPDPFSCVYSFLFSLLSFLSCAYVQVDSSVGGKTGVNHRLGKNMIGAFYQPQCVLIDTDTLASLPNRELASGLAEVIKYGLIRDAEFFEWQEENMDRLLARDAGVGPAAEVIKYGLIRDAKFFEWQEENMDRLLARDPAALAFAIKRSCENKAAVVAADEKEGGLRATLNLGHTFGHAIENGLGYGEWLHGEAVAAGTVMAAHMSHRMGWIDLALRDRITAIIKKARLPTRPPSAVTKEQFRSLMAVRACVRGKRRGRKGAVQVVSEQTFLIFSPIAVTKEQFRSLMVVDKKVADGQLRLILLKGSLGDCVFTVPEAELIAALAGAVAQSQVSFQTVSSSIAEPIAALAGAVAQSQAKLLASVSSSFGDAVTRVQKLIQPSPPGLPPGPSDDSAVRLASDPLAFLDDVARDYPGGIATVRSAGTAFFPGSSLTGNGLLVSDGEVWKRQRRLSNAAFRKAAIQSYATAMAELADDMAMAELADDMAMAELADDMVGGTWTDSLVGRGGRGGRDGVVQGGVVRDVYGDFNELTMKIVVAALFGGGGLGGAAVEQVGPAISTAFDFFAKRATSMLIIPEWFPTLDNLQYTAAVQRLDGVVYRLIEERRKEMAGWAATRGTAQGGGDEGKDLLTRLLLARDEDGSGMDDQSLRDELMTLLVAGQETSAILLAWVCVQLAMHPEEQRRAAEEVWEVLGGQSPTHADVPKLKYLEAVIQETLRLMPPAYIVGRCACRDTRLGEWRVPHGTTVLVSPYLLHRDPQQWPRALTFDPSRWLPGGDALPPADNPAYWPFGGGPRNCIGMGFALLEASLVLARILQSYSLSLPAGSPPPVPRAMITLRPAGEVNLLLTPLAPHPPEEKVTGSRSAGTAGPAAAEPAGTAAAAAAAGTAASPAPAAAAAAVAAAAPTQALPAVAEDAATYGRARSKGLGGKAETTAAST